MSLLLARHEGQKMLSERETFLEVARENGLDVDRFEKDLDDRSLLDQIAADHTEAVTKYGAFGVPTFAFPDGQAAFLKMRPAPRDGDAVAFFEDFLRTAAGRPYIHEIKRPTPP